MGTIDDLFEQDITLENKRVRLRSLRRNDFTILDKIAYDTQIWRWGITPLSNPTQLKAYLDAALHEREAKQSYPFIVYDKHIGKYAGSTRYGAISAPNRRLEIGWTWLHPEFHGSGLNKACKFELLLYAFEELGMNRVEFKTDALNLQSRRAIEKIGATQEGIFRSHLVTANGRIRDSVYFSIIKEEWPGIKTNIFPEYCS